ncbi:two-component sensor histidine kinase [Amaricoccus macauensis]|uniref:histidine kinase n=1 Tax=Amaricoccus macauensis TaxID=57001 RepID=A0A840SI82_9RHOB|nr:sensor histidine kinase [Amaricoccus macauensis]MBB5221587.1 two-component sensor histidine kinase [Amaricoccus macauensis]
MLGFRPKLTLTQRLLALVAMAAVPALAGLVYLIIAIHQERKHEVRDLAFRSSQITSLEVERIVSGTNGILQALALASDVVGGDVTACSDYLDSLTSRLPQFRGFDVVALDGSMVCGSSDLPIRQEDVLSSSWFQDAKASGAFSVGVYGGAQPGEVGYLPLALPVLRAGHPTLILLAGIDLDWLAARLGDRISTEGGAVVIADRNGTILARQPEHDRYVGERMRDPFPSLIRLGTPGVIESRSGDGVGRIVGYQPPAANGIGLYVGTGISTKNAFDPIFASTWRSIAIAAIGVLAAAVIVWWLGNRLLRAPLLRILTTVESWRAGDETARTGIARDGSEISFLAAATDEYMDAVLADRAARRLAEDHRTLLLREMSHRIKNVLATVQAIANQTFRDGAGPDSLRAFGQRLSAMAATHDLLISSHWQSTDLRAAVEAAIGPFAGETEESRFRLNGPRVEITAKGAFSLSMALHELCTNAAKYGALSAPGGYVTIDWTLRESTDGRRFRLSWKEHGGPPSSEPTRIGFGTRLVRAVFTSEFDAHTALEFPQSGVSFDLDADADQILAKTR